MSHDRIRAVAARMAGLPSLLPDETDARWAFSSTAQVSLITSCHESQQALATA